MASTCNGRWNSWTGDYEVTEEDLDQDAVEEARENAVARYLAENTALAERLGFQMAV